MMYQEPLAVYVDGGILDCLSAYCFKNDIVKGEHIALEKIWRSFKEEEIRLVSSGEELEQDIIVRLNGLGCCITDAIQITVDIDRFEKWEKVDKEEMLRWRKIIDYYDQIDFLQTHDEFSGGTGKIPDLSPRDEGLLIFLKRDVFRSERSHICHTEYNDEDVKILRDCANDLKNWYSKELWQDLRGIDYGLNWRILEKALRGNSLKPVLQGEEAFRNRYLLGLLNRIIGFGKKSCPQLPLQHDHVSFIIDAVLKKYCHQQDRVIVHIVKCIENEIDCFLSIDNELINAFNKRRDLFLSHPKCRNSRFEIIRPSELMLRLTSSLIQKTQSGNI